MMTQEQNKQKLLTMRTLFLPLKKEWYEMIESGVKTEEYREIKPYWIKRLCGNWVRNDKFVDCLYGCCESCVAKGLLQTFQYDCIEFRYGYTKRTMTFECKGITIGKGKKKWGAPDNDVFIIKLGKSI